MDAIESTFWVLCMTESLTSNDNSTRVYETNGGSGIGGCEAR